MIKRRVMISMLADVMQEPILYRLVRDFDIVPNVRKADVTLNEAWMKVELQAGSEEQINEAVEYLRSVGATVKPLGGDVVEG